MTRAVLALGCLVMLGSAFAADPVPTWTQWRGPNRSAVLSGQAAWPKSLDNQTLKEVWTVSNLGPSYSGPIVSETMVFTTETVDKKIERVTAFDRKTGKKIWFQEWDGSLTVPFFAAKNGSWIRATPTLDGDRLYVAGIQDLLVCLEAKTGKVLWKFNFVKEFEAPAPTFGFVSSPLVDEKGVYVQAGGCVAKLDKLTGKELWRSLKDGGGMMGSAFSCPVRATLANQDQLVVLTRTHMAGLNLETGKEYWKREIPSFRGMNILTPIVYGSDVFTSTYGGTTQGFRVQKSDANFRVEDGWSFKYEGNMTTPVVIADHAYFLGKDRRAMCVDLKTGKETWRTENRFGEYWSLVGNGDKILALDNRGILYLLKANPKEFEVLAERKVAEAETWAHLAVAGNEIVIRDLSGLELLTWNALSK